MPKPERPRRARRAPTGLKAADLRVRPLARAETIPSAWYTDPRFHDLDRDAVFAATWQYVADVRQLAQPGDHVLAGIRERIAPTHLGSLTFARRIAYDVHANWKVYVDNYLEGYHIPYMHPELLKLYSDYESYRTEVSDWYSVQVGPLQVERNVYTAGGGEALYYHVFPNLMLNVVPGRLQSNVVVPVAPDRCKVIFRYYYDDVTSAAARE